MRYFLLLLAPVLLLGILLETHKQAPFPSHQREMVPSETRVESDSDLRPSEWYHLAREYPDFHPDIQAYAQAMQAARPVAARGGSGFSAPWTVQGPNNIGARVNTIKVHPANPAIIYIGYSQGGVWKTTDGGLTWKSIFDQQPFQAIGAIELDPQNPDIVYVGTGDPNISGYPFIGDGVWKSPDGGQSWQHLGLENQRIISAIAVHPNQSGTLYAAAMGLPFERNPDRGLYKSVNGGQSWQKVLYVSDSTGIIDLKMSPSNPEVLYAASWDRIRNNQESVASGRAAKVWKTTNGGNTWTPLSGGLPQNRKGRIGLAIDAQNSQHVAAMYGNSNATFHAIYQSFNGGLNWQKSPMDGLDTTFQSNFSWYFGKIFINPFNPDDIYACGVTLWRSLDGGDIWFQTTPEWWLYEVHADMHDMAFVDENTCLLATDGGLYRSTDQGFTWDKIENIPSSQFYRVAHNPFQPDWYYGGMQDNGTAGGNASVGKWPRLYGGDGFQPLFHPLDSNIYYYETQDGGIVCTNDGGFSFVKGTEGIDEADRRHWDMQYLLSRHDPDILYTGTQRVYLGVGHPPVWTPVSDDLTDGNIFGSRFHTISTLDESPMEAGLLYVGTTDGNVWRGEDWGSSWANITPGLPDRYVSAVKASPHYPDRVYVAHTGYKSNDFSPHLHRSNDRGQSWVPIAGNLPNLAINDIVILPGYQDAVLFVATDGGVFGTTDGGKNWERLGSGMPVVPVYALGLNPARRTLVAGTFARSIMTFPLDSLNLTGVGTHGPSPLGALQIQVWPNPVAGVARIILKGTAGDLPERATVYLTDLQGRLVWQAPYREQLHLDTRGFAPGVYLASVRVDGQQLDACKVVITR